jgi:hypothetical protein
MEAEGETPPPMTVDGLQDADELQTPNDMLDPQVGRCQSPVLRTLFRGQRRLE